MFEQKRAVKLKKGCKCEQKIRVFEGYVCQGMVLELALAQVVDRHRIR